VILPVEAWMDLRRYQPLRAAGATWREIADEVGLDWRTVKRYLSTDAAAGPPTAPPRKGCVARKVDAVAPVIDAWLAADSRLKASVIHERLVADHGFSLRSAVDGGSWDMSGRYGQVSGSCLAFHRGNA